MKRGKPLKRSPFKRKTYSKPIKVAFYTKDNEKVLFKARQTAHKPRRGKKKLKPIKSLKKVNDALLQRLNRKLHDKCEACGRPNQVAHHWIEKSRSNYLRYDLQNLIPLCNSCHSKIHNIFGNSIVGGLNIAEIIINKRGKEWKERLDKMQPTYQKMDREHLETVKHWLEGELGIEY